jgi:ABC-2 type transport system permease protein
MEQVTIDYSSDNNYLMDGLKEVITPLLDENSQLVESSKEDGIQHVKDNDSIGYIDIEGETITLYINESFGDQGGVLKSAIDAYTTRVNVMMISDNYTVTKARIEATEVDGSNFLTATDYYGIAMTILFIFYAVPMPMSMIITEKTEGTMSRMLLAPVTKGHILLGKLMGSFIVTCVQMSIIFLVTWLILDVAWTQPLYAWLIIISGVFLAMGLGSLLGILFKSEDKAMAIIHAIIVLFAFFGGSYMPLSGIGFLGTIGKFFSPIWWNMNALLNMIYNHNNDQILPTILLNIGIGLVLVFISAVLQRKEENYA